MPTQRTVIRAINASGWVPSNLGNGTAVPSDETVESTPPVDVLQGIPLIERVVNGGAPW